MQDITTTFEATSHRGAAHARFKCILDSVINYEEDSVKGKFFKIENKSYEKIDLLYVHDDGSIGVTLTYGANYGLPCRQVLAVFNSGHIQLNFAAHFDCIYLKPHVRELHRDVLITSPSKLCATPTRITETANVDWMYDFTLESWSTIRLGGYDSTPHQLYLQEHASKVDSIAETVRKQFLCTTYDTKE